MQLQKLQEKLEAISLSFPLFLLNSQWLLKNRKALKIVKTIRHPALLRIQQKNKIKE